MQTNDLGLNRSRSSKCHDLNKLWLAQAPNATYQVSWQSATGSGEDFWSFYLIWAWLPSWSCDLDPPYKQTFLPPSHGCSTWNLTSIGPVVSEKKMFENVDRQQTTDDRLQTTTTEASHTISSPVSLRLRWAKNLKLPYLLQAIIKQQL